MKRISAEVETVTPEQAKRLLAAQDEADHRPIKPSIVLRYAADMRDGRWLLNGESIILNGSKIIDGRHRLSAVVASQASIQSLVVRGIDSSVFASIDSGGVRSPGDVVHIAGFPQGNILAATVGHCYRYDYWGTFLASPHLPVSRAALVEYLKESEAILDAVRWVCGPRDRRTFTRPSVLGAVYALCQNAPTERALFFDELLTGVNLSAASPVRLVRERLFRDRASRTKTRSDVVAALLIKAWNAAFTGREVKILRWQVGESFPVLVNRPPMFVHKDE